MRKTNLLLSVIFLISTFTACDKKATDDELFQRNEKKGTGLFEVSNTESSPVSDEGIIPYDITGSNNGGNRTCNDVEKAFALPDGFFLCGEKLDYTDSESDFYDLFPEGLNVTVKDGKFVSFEMDRPIRIGDGFYKVGAVIVKGSSEANIYYYEDGILKDGGLASPVNASGASADLSNLSFCFVECVNNDPIVIAVKSQIAQILDEGGESWNWAVSDGELFPFSSSDEWCSRLGVNYLKTDTVYDFKTLFREPYVSIGNIVVNTGQNDEGEDCIFIDVIGNDDIRLIKSYLFIGSLSELTDMTDGNGCPDYTSWEFTNLVRSKKHTFVIPIE